MAISLREPGTEIRFEYGVSPNRFLYQRFGFQLVRLRNDYHYSELINGLTQLIHNNYGGVETRRWDLLEGSRSLAEG